jgi:hypothetical protein
MTDTPFVERRFELDGSELVVCFFTSSKAAGGEFQCRYLIGWPEREVRRYACGLDGVQPSCWPCASFIPNLSRVMRIRPDA